MSCIRFIFRGPHLYKDWLVELSRALRVSFYYNISFFPEEGDSDSFIQHAELRKGSIDYCHFSEAYGSSRLELRCCLDLDVILFISSGPRRIFPWPSPTRCG